MREVLQKFCKSLHPHLVDLVLAEWDLASCHFLPDFHQVFLDILHNHIATLVWQDLTNHVAARTRERMPVVDVAIKYSRFLKSPRLCRLWPTCRTPWPGRTSPCGRCPGPWAPAWPSIAHRRGFPPPGQRTSSSSAAAGTWRPRQCRSPAAGRACSPRPSPGGGGGSKSTWRKWGVTQRPRCRAAAITASHLVAKFEDLLQGPAVGVDHDGVGVSVDDFQIHLPDKTHVEIYNNTVQIVAV